MAIPHSNPDSLPFFVALCLQQDKLIVTLVKKDEVNWYDLTSTNSR